MIHTRFALRRPVTTLMTFIAIALIGLIAIRLLPLELFPDIRFPGIQVTIPYAGSTPEEVEQLITRPAEEAIATLSGIKEIRSTSSETGAELVVFFQWDRDPAAVGFEVRTKLESIRHEFPPNCQPDPDADVRGRRRPRAGGAHLEPGGPDAPVRHARPLPQEAARAARRCRARLARGRRAA